MAFPAFLDTCVLYPQYLSDTLLTQADAVTFRPLWSADVLRELGAALTREAGLPPDAVSYRIEQMRAAFPDAEVTGYGGRCRIGGGAAIVASRRRCRPSAVETIGIRTPHRLQQGARLGLARLIGVEQVKGTAGVDDRGRDVVMIGVPPSPAEQDHARGPRVVLVLVGKLREEMFDLGTAVESGEVPGQLRQPGHQVRQFVAQVRCGERAANPHHLLDCHERITRLFELAQPCTEALKVRGEVGGRTMVVGWGQCPADPDGLIGVFVAPAPPSTSAARTSITEPFGSATSTTLYSTGITLQRSDRLS